MKLQLNQIEIYKINLPLARPFVTSFGSMHHRNIILIKITDSEGFFGIGEAPVLDLPLYNAEFFSSTLVTLTEIILPFLKNKSFDSPEEMDQSLKFIKGHYFAKSALSIAAYDLDSKLKGQTLSKTLGMANHTTLRFSNTLSLYDQIEDMLQEAKTYTDVKTIKLKIKPGHDLEYLSALRKLFPKADLMVDANASYTYNSETIDLFKRMEEVSLFCIEQPLDHKDLIDHAKLQKLLSVPLALDESIESLEDLRKAHEMGSCKMLNIKIPRVGGLTEARKIHEYCLKYQIPAWVGGMVESPIGISANLAFAGLPGCHYPIDFLDPIWLIPNYEQYFKKIPYKITLDQISVDFFGNGLSENINLKLLTQGLR